MPVRLSGTTGITRNVSVGGMYFEVEDGMGLGSEISFEVEMATPNGRMVLKCTGLVVRKDSRDGRTGVGVKVVESHLEAVDRR